LARIGTRRRRRWIPILLLIVAVLVLATPSLLSALGRALVAQDPPARADAIVVLHSGVREYERLVEAATLYRDGYAPRVVINGGRTSAALRALRERGLQQPCGWDAEALAVLDFLGVPSARVLRIPAERAFDTVSEARAVVPVLRDAGIASIIVVTSKAHTRRARHIWRRTYPQASAILMVAARGDPFDANRWWHEGRQVNWVLNELGGWIVYAWNRVGQDG